jgi:hypothetical protein
MGCQIPGSLCSVIQYVPIDEGTLIRSGCATPAPVNVSQPLAGPPKFNKTKAAESVYDNSADTYADALKNAQAQGHKTTRCAHYVRMAIAAGGLQVQPPASAAAKDYGPKLIAAGFRQLAQQGYTPKAADVIVYQPIEKHPNGHMQMYDGDQWDSDFTQASIYPSSNDPAWKEASYAIYRFPD